MILVDEVFPACAGMNRAWWGWWWLPARVPRMRGDEPVGDIAAAVLTACSPHARG